MTCYYGADMTIQGAESIYDAPVFNGAKLGAGDADSAVGRCPTGWLHWRQ